MRDIVRKTKDDARLQQLLAQPLSLAVRARHQRQNERGRKVYSLHAPEVEMHAQVKPEGRGQGASAHEFGVKVSVATTLARSKGDQFIAHVKTLPGNPYDGHTLETRIPEIETQIGASLARIVADRGYRGYNAPPGHKMKVYISGQKRGVTKAIKRDLRRRSAVEPVTGHTTGNTVWAELPQARRRRLPRTPRPPPPATTSAVCWLKRRFVMSDLALRSRSKLPLAEVFPITSS